jgi:hypothetical protein
MMKSRGLINLLTGVFFVCILFMAVPVMAQDPIRGMQLALRGINADDAEAAIDDETPQKSKQETQILKKDNAPQSPQLEAKELKTDNAPQNLEQELQELKQEVQRIRSENEARKKLEIPEEEKNKSAEDILSAVSRQYTLSKKGTLGLQYSFSYSYYSGDVIGTAVENLVQRRINHNLSNVISSYYALWDNLGVSAGIPFAYKYNQVGTSSAQESTDLGDVSLGFQVQPFKAGGNIPTTILSLGLSLPTGTSPYKVDPQRSLASGSGLYSLSGGVSLSKVLDPLVAFGNFGYTYSFPDDTLSQRWGAYDILTKVQPGSSIGLSMGFGYALSYQASLNLSANVGYSFNSKYTLNYYQTYETGTSVSASFNVGTGWRVSQARSIYVSLGIGLTTNDPDFSLSFNLPLDF